MGPISSPIILALISIQLPQTTQTEFPRLAAPYYFQENWKSLSTGYQRACIKKTPKNRNRCIQEIAGVVHPVNREPVWKKRGSGVIASGDSCTQSPPGPSDSAKRQGFHESLPERRGDPNGQNPKHRRLVLTPDSALAAGFPIVAARVTSQVPPVLTADYVLLPFSARRMIGSGPVPSLGAGLPSPYPDRPGRRGDRNGQAGGTVAVSRPGTPRPSPDRAGRGPEPLYGRHSQASDVVIEFVRP